MGWVCNNCNNNYKFIELNKVFTNVFQDETTKINKIVNKFVEKPLIQVKCAKCSSSNIKWVNLVDQDSSYLFAENLFVFSNFFIDTMVLEITNKCNLNCIYCPRIYKSSELDIGFIKKIIKENYNLKNPIKFFELGWDMGNPLIHPNIKEILKIFLEKECNVNILTNGKNFFYYLKKSKIENIILNSKKFSLTFFLDHPVKDLNDFLMSKNCYNESIKVFEFLKNNNIKFNIYMRISKYNFNQIKKMQELVKKFDSNLTPIELYPIGKMDEDMIINDKQKKVVLDDIKRYNLNLSIHFNKAFSENNCTYQRKKRLCINARKELSFCHFLTSIDLTKIKNIDNISLLELIQINNQIREGFLKNKNRNFKNWQKPRETSSPCSYCLSAFGINKQW
ncbi:MAG: radical SAM protein [Candidatus Woesearchaeota archaeon]